jgi:hypothetical protein
MDNNKVELETKIVDCYKEYESLFSEIDGGTTNTADKIEEVESLIDHVNQRIQYTETRITRSVTFSVTLIGIGMAFFAVLSRYDGLLFYLGLFATASLVITGGLAAIIHSLQVNPKYPFRALSNDWKWFYPNIVDNNYRPTWYVKESEEKYLEKRLLHIKGLKKYADKIMQEDKAERLKVDIQQLYLLHVNEKYKNAFLSTLRKIIFRGLLITAVFFGIFFIAVTADKICPSSNKSMLNLLMKYLR